jgi:cytoplasmic iron level regulating protein YaaA (DUF328/UPF0246 family)
MLVLLPPSETKRDGGTDSRALALESLRFPELSRERTAVLSALKRLSRNLGEASAALGLSPSQRFEIERNRTLSTAPVMPVIDRYTGVLYDGVEAHSLAPAERQWIIDHVLVNSALFGLVGAGDEIPAYRLSHNTRLPALTPKALSLKSHWRCALGSVLAASPGLVLDLRSESYAALGPLPLRDDAVYLRVVSQGPDGRKKALTHFNKKGKGEFLRRLAGAGIDHATVDSLLDWASGAGVDLQRGAAGELDLTV